MMQNILVTSLTPLHNVDEISHWENHPFCGTWPERREKLTDINRTIKKKPKRKRTAYTTEQLRALEHLYTQNKYIDPDRRRDISKNLNICDKSVKIWFQNRRMKEKKSSSESSSDSSNETLISDFSPPPFVAKECQNSEPINTNQNSEHFHSLETTQYQVPWNRNYTSDEYVENAYANMTANNMQFYNDTNVYPTHYYPYTESNCVNDYTYYQYQQENVMYHNILGSNNVQSTYFYN